MTDHDAYRELADDLDKALSTLGLTIDYPEDCTPADRAYRAFALLAAASVDGMLRSRDDITLTEAERREVAFGSYAAFEQEPGDIYAVVIERLAEAVSVLKILQGPDDNAAVDVILRLISSGALLLSSVYSLDEHSGFTPESGPGMIGVAREAVRKALQVLDRIAVPDPGPGAATRPPSRRDRRKRR